MARRRPASEIRGLLLVAMCTSVVLCFVLSGLPRGGGGWGNAQGFVPSRPQRPLWIPQSILGMAGVAIGIVGMLGTLATLVVHRAAMWRLLNLYFLCATYVTAGAFVVCLAVALSAAAASHEFGHLGLVVQTLPLMLSVVVAWRLTRRAIRSRVWSVERGGLEHVFD